MRQITTCCGASVVLAALITLSGCQSDVQASRQTDSDRQAARPLANLERQENMETQKAMFGAGCFWGVEQKFREVEGVVDTAVGYSGGAVENPTYRQVCTDETGHAEVVLVEFDPKMVSYERLVDLFFELHDPTQVNRQGPDVGRQYRSVVYAYDDAQREVAEKTKAELDESGRYARPIATAIEPAQTFWRAEEYHQQYLAKRGMTSCATTIRDAGE